MKQLVALVVLCLAVPDARAAGGGPIATADPATTAYLVPFRPALLKDSYGGGWRASLIGYNFSFADVFPVCDQERCPALRAQEAFYLGGPPASSAEPMVLRIPADRTGDVVLEQEMMALKPSSANSVSRSVRLPVIRLDAITDRTMTFLHVNSDGFNARTIIRVYSPLTDVAERVVTMTVFEEFEGRSSALFRREFMLTEVLTNDTRIGFAVLPWPEAVGETAFPVRVTLESDGPIWGFVTTTERSVEPAVSLTLPLDGARTP